MVVAITTMIAATGLQRCIILGIVVAPVGLVLVLKSAQSVASVATVRARPGRKATSAPVTEW
jgi:hypothetical protein